MPESKIANVNLGAPGVDGNPDLHTLVRVWDLPARIWHWTLICCLTFSVCSGLSGSIALMDWHLRSGYAVIVLLLFRLAWGFWGGRYVRFGMYWTCLVHASSKAQAHTRPGVLMLVGLILLLTIQTVTGLFTTDDLFTQGPFNNYVSDKVASNLGWVHRRNFWLIVAMAAVHIGAIGHYGLRRKNPLAMSMFNGRKLIAGSAPESKNLLLRAMLSLCAAAGLLWWLLERY